MANFAEGFAIAFVPLYVILLIGCRLIEKRWAWAWPLELLSDLLWGSRG